MNKLNCRFVLACGLPLLAFLLAFSPIAPAHAQSAAPVNSLGSDWCRTQQFFEASRQMSPTDAKACFQYGPCDDPVNRNIWIPSAQTEWTTIRLRIHLVTNTDGSSPSTNPTAILQNVTKLNANYAPLKINFTYTTDTIRNTLYRSLADSEMNKMKIQYAVQPDSMLNVYVAYVEGQYSYGTFPWDPAASSSTGGIVMTTDHFSGISSAFAHEVGHCLGLWHTFNGVSEVTPCGSCYERVGTTDHDLTGDRCSDTDPTPRNQSCAAPGGLDTCTGLSWGPTDVQNYMGYSGDACWSEFSVQQTGRMHCWLNDVLFGWTSNVSFSPDTTLGPSPLPVNFTAASPKNVTSWLWDFGDGGSSAQQNPQHIYTLPGLYNVKLTIQSASGSYVSNRQQLIGVYADSLKGDNVAGAVGQPVAVDISLHNSLPIKDMVIPITWSGPAGLYFDSASTVGLRSNYLSTNQFLTLDPSVFMRGAYRLGSGAAQTPLAAGNGPVLRIFFTVTGSPVENPVSLGSFDNGIRIYEPILTTSLGKYLPVVSDGMVSFCRAGDVNADGNGPNLSDLALLVSYLTSGQGAIPVMANANVNAVNGVNLADLALLVSYLTSGAPSLLCN